MKFKTIFTCIIAIQMAACQQNDDVEATIPNDATTTEIEQLALVSDDTDLVNLPTSATYVKEQSLKGENTSPYGYVVRRPEGFGTDGKQYPILVFLHGVGNRGNSANNPDDLNKVDQGAAIRAIKLGLWSPKVALPVFAPQTSANWEGDELKKFIEYLIDTYPNAINTNRIYLSGFSMGGYGTWTYLNSFSYDASLIAAAVSLAGTVDVNDTKIEGLKLMPFWMFHGQRDPTLPVSRSTSVANKFEAQYPDQNHQKITVFTQDDFDGQYHRIDHGVYDQTFWDKNQTGEVFDVDIVNWMLQYKRPD
ncbi:hypothetical protein [Algibacter luteus]|uniref:carboxylesterase family protein n=1 Tax=Algibacter luteus TaxID=1178825 RepID=UPI002597EEFB|nr:hypothetical protein [Algibacter luteus]WJJ95726.1 hypothetical protein O5O44_10870 [Algibacter luteus]